MSELRCKFVAVTPYQSESLWRLNYKKAREIKDYLGFMGCTFIVFNESETSPGTLIISFDPNHSFVFSTADSAQKKIESAFPELTLKNLIIFDRYNEYGEENE